MDNQIDTVEKIRQIYNEQASEEYRRIDKQMHASMRHYSDLLQSVTSRFLNERSDALDVGCGTGRFFHALRNVKRLVGIDLSAHMLEQARHPANSDQITIESIELICRELTLSTFPAESFDLIYSIGVFGEYAPIDTKLLNMFYQLLRPQGLLFITAVDALSRVDVAGVNPTIVQRAVRKCFPVLPASVRILANHFFSPYHVTKAELERRFYSTSFSHISITPYVHISGWRGTHLDSLAFKS